MPAAKNKTSATKIPAAHGSTLGMKPPAFKALKAIAGQPVGSISAPVVKPREEKEEKGRKSALVDEAKKRFDMAAEAEAENRKNSLDDLKFFSGDQWEDGIKRQRHQDGRPCLTINRLPQFVRQVTNEQRQNRPSIQVNPVGDGADVETAEVLQGMVRHIEYASAADAAYDTAFFGAASCGFGYFRVVTDYSDPMSFDQDIKIVRIRNPFTVYLDPAAKEADYSDADWGFVVDTMSKENYKAAHPDSELSKMEDWQSIGDTNTDWIAQDECRIAEYYYREKEPATLYLLRGGAMTLEKPADENEIEDQRPTERIVVKWAKLNGIEVLEETDWPSQWIPIVKVIGEELDIDGKLTLKGIVRDAKEPQQQYNYMKSASTEAIALAPKAPYVGEEGQFEGHEREWQQANVKNYAYLMYKGKNVGGQQAPPPQRQNFEPAIQAITLAMNESADDLKAVTGIYDAALGAQGNETSGKAILARQQQGQGANFHYIDNLSRALRFGGKIILELIPKIYDTARVVRIISPEGEQKIVQLKPGAAQPTPDQVQQGIARAAAVREVFDVTVGKYDVTISTGPSYQSRRQEAVSSILDLVKAFPALMGVAGDILVQNMDWPGAKKIAERLKTMLPPNLQENEGQQQLPPEAQQAIAQGAQQVQELTQQLQAAQADLKQQTSVKQMETGSKERIAAGEHRIRELELQLEYKRLEIEATKVQALLVTAQQKIDAAAADAEAKRSYDAMAQIVDQEHQVGISHMEHVQGLEAAQHAAAIAPPPADPGESGEGQGGTDDSANAN